MGLGGVQQLVCRLGWLAGVCRMQGSGVCTLPRGDRCRVHTGVTINAPSRNWPEAACPAHCSCGRYLAICVACRLPEEPPPQQWEKSQACYGSPSLGGGYLHCQPP
jgi:hypothetical protein